MPHLASWGCSHFFSPRLERNFLRARLRRARRGCAALLRGCAAMEDPRGAPLKLLLGLLSFLTSHGKPRSFSSSTAGCPTGVRDWGVLNFLGVLGQRG